VGDPLLTKQNGGLREIFTPVHIPMKKVRGEGRGVVKVETEN